MKKARKLTYFIIAVLLFSLWMALAAGAEGLDAGPAAETESSSQSITTPEETGAEPAKEPAAEPAAEPAKEPAAEPAAEPAKEPAAEPAKETAAVTTPQPESTAPPEASPTEVIIPPKPTPSMTSKPVTREPDRPTPTPAPTATPAVQFENSYEENGVIWIVRESDGTIKGELSYHSDGKEFASLKYAFNREESKPLAYEKKKVEQHADLNGYMNHVPFEINPENASDNQAYAFSLYLENSKNDQITIRKMLSFVPRASITVNGGEPIFRGDDSITVSVKNRENGKIIAELHPRDAALPVQRLPEIGLTNGEAVVPLAGFALEKYDHITVKYRNAESWDKSESKEEYPIDLNIIECAADGEARIFPSDKSKVRIQVEYDNEKTATISFTDSEGHLMVYPVRSGAVEIPYAALEGVSAIVCGYPQYSRRWEYTLSFDGTEADLQYVLLPELAFDEKELDEDAEKITVINTVPGKAIELLIDGQPADADGTEAEDGKKQVYEWDKTHYFHAGQTISARTEDDYGNPCEAEIVIQPIDPSPILLSLEEIQDQFKEAEGCYYINQSTAPEIHLKGEAHKNRNLTLRITADGAESQDVPFAAGADGKWAYTLSLADLIGPQLTIAVSYENEAYPGVSEPLKICLDNTADAIIIHTALIDGTDEIEVTGEPYAAFQLFVDGGKEGDPVSADSEGRALLKTGAPLSPLSDVRVEMTDLAGNSAEEAAGPVGYKALHLTVQGDTVSSAHEATAAIAGSGNAKFDLFAAVQDAKGTKTERLIFSDEIMQNGQSSPILIDLTLLNEYFGQEPLPQTVILYAAYTGGNAEEAEQFSLRYDPSCLLQSDDVSEKAQMRANASGFTVSGIAEPDAQVSLYIDGELVKEETADQEGAFTFAQLQHSLLRGKKNISLKARDTAGNEASLGPALKQFSLLTWQQYVFLLTGGCLLFVISLLGFLSAKKERAKPQKHYSSDTVHID